VFARNGGTWTQQAYLKASNTAAGDEFGTSVAISGDTVLVGAEAEPSAAIGVNGNQNDDSAGAAGAACLFARNAVGWSRAMAFNLRNEADPFLYAYYAVGGHIAEPVDSPSWPVHLNQICLGR